MSDITITSAGNLIKFDWNRTVRYFEHEDILTSLQINPISLLVSFNHRNLILPEHHISQISINGTTPTDLATFETAINSMFYYKLFGKLDPLIAIGFMSTALTAPVRRMAVLGNNPDVDTGSVPETIWPGGGLYPWMTGATSLEAVSTSVQDSPTGTGMGAISLTLMNTSYVESNVAVTLNGTTAVPITGTWYRINGGLTTVKGSGAAANNVSNAGDIIIRDAGGGTTRSIIQAGKGITRQAIFTTPAGYSFQIISQYIGFNRGSGGATRFLTANVFLQSPTGVARRALDISCDGEPYRHDGIPGIMIPEKFDFAMEAATVSAENSDVTGAFLGVLMRNDLISTLSYP